MVSAVQQNKGKSEIQRMMGGLKKHFIDDGQKCDRLTAWRKQYLQWPEDGGRTIGVFKEQQEDRAVTHYENKEEDARHRGHASNRAQSLKPCKACLEAWS